MRITEVLKHGRENATRADVLAAKLETTPRGLRSLIMKAKLKSVGAIGAVRGTNRIIPCCAAWTS